MSLWKQYEVTTLAAFVRDELHPLRLPSTANLTRELSRSTNEKNKVGMIGGGKYI